MGAQQSGLTEVSERFTGSESHLPIDTPTRRNEIARVPALFAGYESH